MAKVEQKVSKVLDGNNIKLSNALQQCLNGASAGNNRVSDIIKNALFGGNVNSLWFYPKIKQSC